MSDHKNATMNERNWLMTLVTDVGHQPVTDSGFDFVTGSGEFVYQTPQARWEVKIRRMEPT